VSTTLRKRPKSNDYDLVDDDGTAIGQVIASDRGCTIYLLGDYEPLLPPAPDADAALEAYEEWAASNTVSDILVLHPSPPAQPTPDPGP
jgi:hypothetical protein